MTYITPKHQEPISPVGKVAELFAGVGGFRVGLARAGWQTVFSNQWEPSTKAQHASDVYVARFGPEGHTNVDISTLEKISVPFDLLVGGFPCQDYSVAKSRSAASGLKGKKGVLWWEMLRLIQQHRPKLIFLENVDRLLKSPTSQRGRDFAVMLNTLGNLGYLIEWRVVNAADYGFPQRRIRVFIVAKRKDIFNRNVDPSNYIFENGTFAKALPVKQDDSGVSEFKIDDDPEKVSLQFNATKSRSPFLTSGMYVDGKVYTAKTFPNFEGKFRVLGDVLVEPIEVPDEYWVKPESVESWKYLKGAKSEERTHKSSGFQYKYTEGNMSFPDSLKKPSRTILTAEGGTTPSRFKHIVEVDGRLRRLLPVELERLAGFPDDWTRLDGAVTDGRRAFFIGNALVVGVVENVGRQLAAELNELGLSQ